MYIYDRVIRSTYWARRRLVIPTDRRKMLRVLLHGVRQGGQTKGHASLTNAMRPSKWYLHIFSRRTYLKTCLKNGVSMGSSIERGNTYLRAYAAPPASPFPSRFLA